jgi:spore cortex formation protein SpoVR/YcgB (stage V sporulation)
MAHVYGHCDFFKNNYYFSHTNRKMMDQMANHARASAATWIATARTWSRTSSTPACRSRT